MCIRDRASPILMMKASMREFARASFGAPEARANESRAYIDA